MTRDLTVGNPGTVLWRFCLPLFGNVIHLLEYHTAEQQQTETPQDSSGISDS